MRALDALYHRLTTKVGFMHAARWRSFWRSVGALIKGEQLWLTGIGRARAGEGRQKHSIKAVDRLLGNKQLRAEMTSVYSVLASLLLGKNDRPIILVDTVQVGGRFALCAALAFEGRSLPIYSITTKAPIAKKPTCRRFLRDLSKVLPERCRPILVTDAGFERPWFEAVGELNWDYIGRIRGHTSFNLGEGWISPADIQARAESGQSQDLGSAWFPRRSPCQRRLVLSKKPTSKHRRRKTARGKEGRREMDAMYKKGANEAWLLTTSLESCTDQVVAIYALRMQIEESFRDLKNHRWGWSLRHARSRSKQRLEVLLLIAAFAAAVQQVVGLAGERAGLHRHHQANTIASRRVLSYFVLGGLILRNNARSLMLAQLYEALSETRRRLRTLSALAAS